MGNKLLIGLLSFFVVVLAGCLTDVIGQQYICKDGTTIVSNLNDCPKIDTEYEECQKASTQVSSYDYESPRDICFYNLAMSRENVTLCRKILTSDTYSTYSAANCGAEIALVKDDPLLCEELGIVWKYDCYARLVEETDDPSYCDRITVTKKRDNCLYEYIVYDTYSISDWSICSKFSKGSSEADYCYYSAATNKRNTTYCDKITGADSLYSYSKGECYGEVGKKTKNPSICEQLTDVDKEDCYYTYATSYPYNVTVCDKISDSYRKDDCVYYANYSYDY